MVSHPVAATAAWGMYWGLAMWAVFSLVGPGDWSRHDLLTLLGIGVILGAIKVYRLRREAEAPRVEVSPQSPGSRTPAFGSSSIGTRRTVSYAWAFAPVLTFGLVSGPCIAYAAVKLGSRRLWWGVGVYGSASVVFWVLSGASNQTVAAVGAVVGMVSGVVATAHAFRLRRRLLDL